jgi:hypothetical protein
MQLQLALWGVRTFKLKFEVEVEVEVACMHMLSALKIQEKVKCKM